MSAGRTPGISLQLTSVCRQGIARACRQHGKGQLGSLLPIRPPQKPLQQRHIQVTSAWNAFQVRTRTHASNCVCELRNVTGNSACPALRTHRSMKAASAEAQGSIDLYADLHSCVDMCMVAGATGHSKHCVQIKV